MHIPRPTASTITDDQLDALWDALDQIEDAHPARGDYCDTCGGKTPCYTLRIISRQRSHILESTCPRSPTGPDD